MSSQYQLLPAIIYLYDVLWIERFMHFNFTEEWHSLDLMIFLIKRQTIYILVKCNKIRTLAKKVQKLTPKSFIHIFTSSRLWSSSKYFPWSAIYFLRWTAKTFLELLFISIFATCLWMSETPKKCLSLIDLFIFRENQKLQYAKSGE